MNRHLYALSHQVSERPGWICPRDDCNGTLSINLTKDDRYETDLESQIELEQAYQPAYDNGRYSITFRCDRCSDAVMSVGDYFHSEVELPDRFEYVCCISPKFFYPPLRLIEIPAACPDKVRDALIQAFSAYWSAPGNAANSLRVALEHLMEAQKVEGGNLHKRIQNFAAVHPEAAMLLEAVKWVGNVGAHEGTVEYDALLSVFEMVEHVLSTLYPEARARLLRAAQAINEAKGR